MIASAAIILGIVGLGIVIAVVILAIVFRHSERVQIKVEVVHDIDKGEQHDINDTGGDQSGSH